MGNKDLPEPIIKGSEASPTLPNVIVPANEGDSPPSDNLLDSPTTEE